VVPVMVIPSGEIENDIPLRSRRARRATTTSGVKGARHPKGLKVGLGCWRNWRMPSKRPGRASRIGKVVVSNGSAALEQRPPPAERGYLGADRSSTWLFRARNLAMGIVLRAMAALSPSRGYNPESAAILAPFASNKKTLSLGRHGSKCILHREIVPMQAHSIRSSQGNNPPREAIP
jgi:hypothetical protein